MVAAKGTLISFIVREITQAIEAFLPHRQATQVNTAAPAESLSFKTADPTRSLIL